jgi:hypothetical protein
MVFAWHTNFFFYSILVCLIVGPNSLCVLSRLLRHGYFEWCLLDMLTSISFGGLLDPTRSVWYSGCSGICDILVTFEWCLLCTLTSTSFGGLLDPTHFVCYQGCSWSCGILATLKWCLADFYFTPFWLGEFMNSIGADWLWFGYLDIDNIMHTSKWTMNYYWLPFLYYMLFSKVSLQNIIYYWK